MDYKKSFSTKLKMLRKEYALSSESLGKILNVTHSTISLLESGKRLPSLEVFYAIAKYFNVSADWLLGCSNNRNINNISKTTEK